MTRRLWWAALALCVACEDKGRPTAPPQKPPPAEPFKPLTNPHDDTFQVGPFTPAGLPIPEGLTRIELDGDTPVKISPRVLLVPGGETYLAQVNALLAALDDAGAEVWLKHPEGDFAYPVELRDETAWQAWIDEAVPGKLRIIHRADGFELQTNLGKLPGGDPNGPSVPVRGGRMDLPTLRKGLERVKARFPDAPDVCFAPSMGLPMADVSAALAAVYPSPDAPIFAQLCLVYPRPKAARDAGR